MIDARNFLTGTANQNENNPLNSDPRANPTPKPRVKAILQETHPKRNAPVSPSIQQFASWSSQLIIDQLIVDHCHLTGCPLVTGHW
jgi:hypothetical protein